MRYEDKKSERAMVVVPIRKGLWGIENQRKNEAGNWFSVDLFHSWQFDSEESAKSALQMLADGFEMHPVD